jgi:hypothetical protein
MQLYDVFKTALQVKFLPVQLLPVVVQDNCGLINDAIPLMCTVANSEERKKE